MAFDGVAIREIVNELQDKLIGGRLYKIAQPENDELLITIKQSDATYRLVLSANPTLPLIYLSSENKPGPLNAPNFCMLLRKHLQNGRIVSITQPGLERIVIFEIEHLDEMGDLCRKKLIIEIMGKHSNLVFVNSNDIIVDSIKRVSSQMSSKREVLPGRSYFMVDILEKLNLFDYDFNNIKADILSKPMPLYKAIYSSFTGISPTLAIEICNKAGIDADIPTAGLNNEQILSFVKSMRDILEKLKRNDFSPCIAYEGGKPVEFNAFELTGYADTVRFDSMSEVVEKYYHEKEVYTRIRQRSTDLRKTVSTILERDVKKYDLQLLQMKDTEKKDKYRIYGELLNTYGYSAKPGDKSIDVINYYTNEPMTIPLDETLSATDNAKKYFDKYAKLKRTYEALENLTKEVEAEIEHLRSIENALDIARSEDDLMQIRDELYISGYVKKHASASRKIKSKSKPFHYISSDGYDIYVGRNNLQNDELTFKFAIGNDWWFHAKKAPGSHVILKSGGSNELPDRAFEEAAALAAYYSSVRDQDKVEIDYVLKKQVKKPVGAKPGFVVYYTNYSMIASSDISKIREISD